LPSWGGAAVRTYADDEGWYEYFERLAGMAGCIVMLVWQSDNLQQELTFIRREGYKPAAVVYRVLGREDEKSATIEDAIKSDPRLLVLYLRPFAAEHRHIFAQRDEYGYTFEVYLGHALRERIGPFVVCFWLYSFSPLVYSAGSSFGPVRASTGRNVATVRTASCRSPSGGPGDLGALC
jgi:hypothetical protein